jgi:NAD(P)-dependent dehydrogenase (short-subunit alcohol dehydrogenase family)
MSGDVAIVTGAGSGIGRATCVELVRRGLRLLAVGRDLQKLRETARLCGASCEVLAVDVSRVNGVLAMVARACAMGRVAALVNNAGVGLVRTIEESTPEVIDETMRINAMSPAWAIHELWPMFRRAFEADRSFRGAVVNVTSMATVDPFPGFFAYAASKAAANLLIASAAKEGAAIGVRAFAVAPGAVETPMLRAAFDESVVPREAALEPGAVARVIGACVGGERDGFNGRVIHVVPEAARGWFAQWRREHAWVVEGE